MADEEIQTLVKDIANLVRETKIFNKYQTRLAELKENPELYKRVKEYRELNYKIQNETPEEEMFDRLEAFEKEYEEFRANPLVDRFLSAELGFCRLMQQMDVLLLEELDFE